MYQVQEPVRLDVRPVSDHYHLLQPMDVAAALDPLTEWWPLDTAGVVDNWSTFWFQLEMNVHPVGGYDDEAVKTRLTVIDKLKGGAAYWNIATERVVCSNTVQMSLWESHMQAKKGKDEWYNRISHKKNAMI